jgi:hypothetical protein
MIQRALLGMVGALLVACAAGCASAQEPYQFTVAEPSAVSVDDLVRALAQQGQQAAEIDEYAGVVYTVWQDTGFLYGEVDDEDATIVRRYVATLQHGEAAASVQLRIDSMRCAPDRFDIDGYVLEGRCESMSGVVSAHQRELDELGQRVEASLQTR